MRKLKANDLLFAPFLSLSFAAHLCGCDLLKARPAPDEGFLPYSEKLKEDPNAPFHGVWIPDQAKLDALKATYHKILIQPVVTELLVDKIKKSDYPDGWKEERIEDTKAMAQYFEARMKENFAVDKKFKVITDADDAKDSFVWEIAIIDLKPTSPALTVATTAAGVFIPGAGLIALAGAGSIAIEGIVRDGNTGDVLATFKDRRSDKNSAFSVKDYQMYAHSRETIDDWSKEFFELITAKPGEKIEGAAPVTLSPF